MTEQLPPLTSLRQLLLVDCDERTQVMLDKCVRRLGMKVTTVSSHESNIDADVVGLIVEIDDFRSEDIVEQARQSGLPIIALSRHETLSQIQSAIRMGATAMINRPVTQSSIYTSLMMAERLGARIQSLEAEVVRLSDQLRLRPAIAKSVARLMNDYGIDEHEAFERIRNLSMNLNVSIEAICADLEQRSPKLGSGS